MLTWSLNWKYCENQQSKILHSCSDGGSSLIMSFLQENLGKKIQRLSFFLDFVCFMENEQFGNYFP